MEVIHIILGKANPERMNGVNKVVNELAEKQAQSGINVSVWGITTDLNHNYPQRSYTTRLFIKKTFPFHICADLEKAIYEQNKPVVFHLHGGFIPLMYSIGMLLQRLNLPFVFTPHGSYNTLAMKKNAFVKKIYRKFFELPLLQSATTIHALGRSEITGLMKWYPNEKTILIPYGYDFKKISYIHDKSIRPFVIGYCGRIDIFTKGLDALIAGFDQFLSFCPNSELWILGNGSEMPALKKLTTLKSKNKIKFYGAVYGAEKDELLSKCQIFAHPSRNEGLPSSILEAASIGLPCLVSTATNLAEVINQFDAGEVIGQPSGEAVFAGILSLYTRMATKNESARLSANAQTMIGEAFNWEALLERYWIMYKIAIA